MLYNQVETSLTCAGLDCQIGIWHRDNYQTPSLAFDVIEPLRPKIDRLLIGLLTENILQQNFFEHHVQYGYLANKSAKQVIIPAFNNYMEDRIKMNGRITQFKNHILQLAYFIKKRIEIN